eukprot:TRINITY_DN428_c0_g1_i1.p1 TRINITY_DN428_c0_g1~~TRINITY_DN428_c0_g1_i1.p1  ORF type:complete len:255 (-),score=64.97 TRINITY_DN428_c0_g1_i1:60-824(-)
MGACHSANVNNMVSPDFAADVEAKQQSVYDDETMAEIAKAWPAYYNPECSVYREMLGPLREDWKIVLTGNSQKFRDHQVVHPESQAIVFFWDLFWDKANQDDDLKRYFNTMNLKAKGLANILTTIIKILSIDSESEREAVLVKLAHWHNSDEMHVRERHFCNLGGTLIYALSNFLDVWDDATAKRWVDAYSYLLKHMLPVIVAYRVDQKRQGHVVPLITNDVDIARKADDAAPYIGPVPDNVVVRGDDDLVNAL